jgi:hypothetical protein
MRIVMPPRSTKICGAPRAVVLAVIVAPNILDTPIRRGFRILADDVNMVEFEGGITHGSSLVCEIARADRLPGHLHQLRRV